MRVLLLLACTEVPDAPADRFRVSSVLPEDGSTDVVEAMTPELRFSDPIDPEACTPETLRLDAIHDDGTVAFPVPVTVADMDDGYRIQLRRDEAPLPVGWTYAISARAGDEDGCISVDGALLAPFASTFAVAP